MSTPVKIVVTAETAQAAAAANSGLQQMSKGGVAATEGMKITREGVRSLTEPLREMNYALMLSGASFPEFSRGLGLLSTGLLGTRALTMSLGISLGALVPIVLAITAAVGGGLYVWHELGAGESEAEQKAKDRAEAFKGLIPILKQINDLQQAGLLSGAAASNYTDYLTGKKKLYVDEEGKVTPMATRQAHTQTVGAFGGLQESEGVTTVANKPASLEQVQKYITDQATSGGMIPEEQSAALEKLTELERKAHEESLSKNQQEIAAIHDKYEKERQEIQQTALVAGAKLGNINFANDPKVKAASSAMDDTRLAEARDVAAKQQEFAKQAAEAENKVREQYQKQFAEANKSIDDNISLQAAQAGQKREALYQQEYLERAATALKFYLTGKISEDEYTKAVTEAQTKLYEGLQKANTELERQLQIKNELAQADAEAKLKQIQLTPGLSDRERAAQSVKPLTGSIHANMDDITSQTAIVNNPAKSDVEHGDALREINRLTLKQIELQDQLTEAQNQSSFLGQMKEWADNLKKVNDFSQDAANIFQGALQTGIQSVASNLTQVIEGTKTWRQGLLAIEEALLTDVLNAILKVVAELLVEEGVLIVVDALKGVAMFASGGYTGDGGRNEAAGVVHRGEYVFSSPAVQKIGVHNLEAMHRTGYSLGGLVDQPLMVPDIADRALPNYTTNALLSGGGGRGAGAPGAGGAAVPEVKIHHVTVADTQALKAFLKSSDAQHIIVSHLTDPSVKARAGFPT